MAGCQTANDMKPVNLASIAYALLVVWGIVVAGAIIGTLIALLS